MVMMSLSAAASARLCVETCLVKKRLCANRMQPPPRGCVLKHEKHYKIIVKYLAAASARLCVETDSFVLFYEDLTAAASARLCVETARKTWRCCYLASSRLRAAVC